MKPCGVELVLEDAQTFRSLAAFLFNSSEANLQQSLLGRM